MQSVSLKELLSANTYPGRGIVAGRSADGNYAVTAYFIMGRSVNSRNRIFIEDGEGIRTQAFDPSKLTDPSLIIYAPVRVFKEHTIVTNGDQTDTVYEGLENGLSFEKSLEKREFEPDAPNYTPRISALLSVKDGSFSLRMSILKSADGDPSCCERFSYYYDNPLAGDGRFIHTYIGDGNPLPSFEGEPVRVRIEGGIDEFTDLVWQNLNEDNRVSLFVRYIDLKTGNYESRIVNRHQ